MGKIFKCYSALDTPEDMLFIDINDVKNITSCSVPGGKSKTIIHYYDDKFCFCTSFFCDYIVTIDTDIDEDYKIWLKVNMGKKLAIEGLVEDETSIKLTGKAIKNDEMVVSIDEWNLPQGYQFKDENGNVINATKIVLDKIKKEYPKTYEECCKMLEIHYFSQATVGYKYEILSAFQKLLICRDAYWKIAGEEMGLGKPWKPDWCNEDKLKYCIECSYGTIDKTVKSVWNCILAFPTTEMREAFFENFKKEIEQCKELL